MMNKQISLILLIFVSSNLLSCNGQVKSSSQGPASNNLGIGKKVSTLDDQIWYILQDKQGAYWFGSNANGMYHFDGRSLTHITTADGLIDNTIRGIQEDAKGNIYIETPVGVSKYDGKSISTLQVLQSSHNKWLLEADDLWFNCMGNHLYRFDGEWLHELQLPEQNLLQLGLDTNGVSFQGMNGSPYAVYGIDKDKAGNIWFGTVTAGAFRYDGTSFLWFGEQALSTLPDGRVPGVRSMIQDKDGYFWLSNFYSKYQINATLPKGYEKLKAVDLPAELVQDKILYFNAGLVDQEGNLRMTTYGGGVWTYDGQSLSNQEIHNGIENILLVSIYQDQNGTIWLGTHNDGVYYQHGDRFEKFTPQIIKSGG